MSRRNILWVTLESVRADHTSLNGYQRETTPFLDSLANDEDSTLHQQCRSQSIWTPASSASILTGTYLSDHGVGRDGTGERQLPEDMTTLPELLSDSGYQTACFSPNSYLSPATDLDRGFDDFHWLSKQNLYKAGPRPLLSYLRHIRSHGPGFTLDAQKHNLAHIQNELAKRWINNAANQESPFFAYTHIGNPHLPYTPPRAFIEEFLDDSDIDAEKALTTSLDLYQSTDHLRELIAHQCPVSDESWRAVKALYDAEIAYADALIRSLVQHVKDKAPDTIIIVTADHGDLFGEQGVIGHSLVLHDGLTHVPLLVHGIDGMENGGVVEHIDVTRTVSEAVGESCDQFRGQDLRTGTRDYALSQRGLAHFEDMRDSNPDFDPHRFHKPPTDAISDGDHKLIASDDRSSFVSISDETTDTSNQHPEKANEFQKIRDERVDWMNSDSDHSQAEFTDEMKEQLSDLGYI